MVAELKNKIDSDVSIAKATAGDFERVYPLLQGFNIPRITRDDWKKIFTNNWESPEDFCGLLLVQGDEVKGFLGLLFAQRTIDGQAEKFCNMTSWIVREEVRNKSLSMLLVLNHLTDYTFTNFTPSRTVAAILRKLGYNELPTTHQILLPVPSLGRTAKCVTSIGEMRSELDDSDRRILDDHERLDCRHILISNGDGYCYLVVKNRLRRHVPFARVHYLSNPDVFIKSIDSVRSQLCWKLKVAGLMVDDRYVRQHAFKNATVDSDSSPAFYKSRTLGGNPIDTLYSEMILLHD